MKASQNRISIARTLDALEHYWRKHPTLRLGQVVVNASSEHRAQGRPAIDPFYITDEDLVERLKEQA